MLRLRVRKRTQCHNIHKYGTRREDDVKYHITRNIYNILNKGKSRYCCEAINDDCSGCANCGVRSKNSYWGKVAEVLLSATQLDHSAHKLAVFQTRKQSADQSDLSLAGAHWNKAELLPSGSTGKTCISADIQQYVLICVPSCLDYKACKEDTITIECRATISRIYGMCTWWLVKKQKELAPSMRQFFVQAQVLRWYALPSRVGSGGSSPEQAMRLRHQGHR